MIRRCRLAGCSFVAFTTACGGAALAMTAKLVGMILERQKPDLMIALKGISAEWSEILLFSLKFSVVLGMIGAVMILSTSSALISYRLLGIVASKAFVYPVTLALEAGAGWLLMPATIRLLTAPDAAPVSTESRKLGTILFVLTSAAALALENLIGRVEAGVILENQSEVTAVAVFNTVVMNTPEVLLFIALALLALEAKGQATAQTSAENEASPMEPAAE